MNKTSTTSSRTMPRAGQPAPTSRPLIPAPSDRNGRRRPGPRVSASPPALRCRTCGATHASRIYTLMSAQPQCPACQLDRLEAEARAAGLTHLHRDPDERHYSTYRADCGHRLRRQHEIIRRVGAEATRLRCETCHAAREADETRARGWRLRAGLGGGDPAGGAGHQRP